MKKMIHLASDWNDGQIKVLNEFGVFPKEGFSAIQIEYNLYLKLESHFKNWDISGIPYPEFSKQELKNSTLSAKKTTATHGYPMPDMDFGYLDLTYDLTNYCSNCGIGLKQKDAFRVKNVPPQGKKRMFSLGWVFDELFVDRQLYDDVFKPLGIKSREVLVYKKEIPIENTVQLVLEETSEKLDIFDNPVEKCSSCGRVKYQPMPQSFYPKYNDIIAPIFKSADYFGSGASAYKRIFITKELREKLVNLKIEREDWYVPTE